MAFLSVIIAAHNAEATLHATLSSLLAAIGQDTEVIISMTVLRMPRRQ